MNPASLKIIPFLEKAFACSLLMLLTGAGIPIMAGGVYQTSLDLDEGVPVFQWATAAGYLLSALLCLGRLRNIKQLLWSQMLLWVLLIWTCLSIGWSLDPAISTRRVVAMLGAVVFAIWLIQRFPPTDILRLVATAISITAGASLLAVVLLPAMGIHPGDDVHAGYWRGIYIHKNVMARCMSLGVLAYCWVWVTAPRRSIGLYIGLGLCTIALLGAGSRTAWITTLLFAGLPFVIQYLRLHWSVLIGTSLVAIPATVAAGLVLWVNLDDILQLFGRDLTLTGRTMLWSATWPYAMDRLWLGYGFRVFWLQQNESIWILWEFIGWDPGSAHNSFLELLLDIGLIGLAIFVAGALQCLWRIIVKLRDGDPLAGWYLSFFLFMIVQSISQTILLTPNTIQWVIYVVVLFLAAKHVGVTHARTQLHTPPARRLEAAHA